MNDASASPPPSSAVPIVPGSVHRLRIGPRDDRGRGTASLGRRALRVPNALPGELLDVRLEHIGRTTAEAGVEQVAEGSPDRVADACRHGDVCPGCGLRTTREDARRGFLRARVVASLTAAGLGAVPVHEVVPAPAADGWRRKAFLTVRRTRRGIFLGLYEEHSHRLLGIDGCLAHAPSVEKTLDAIRLALRRVDPSVYDERAKEGWLRYVTVRSSSVDDSTLVTLVATTREYGPERALADEIRRLDRRVVGVVGNVHGATDNSPFGRSFTPLAGNPFLVETTGPFRVRVSAGSFFQVNPAVGGRIHDDVAALVRTAPPGPAVDLYGGVGCTALRIAADGRPVTLVEAPGPAADDARWNAKSVEGPGALVDVRPERVDDAIHRDGFPIPAAVVVNPPRSGLTPGVLDAIRRWKSSLVAYVACDPRPLGRDLRALTDAGWVVEAVQPYELMPQTAHVEALAIVRRPT